jgi:photosystem II stability/assembly factor-like uncharacterized protein
MRATRVALLVVLLSFLAALELADASGDLWKALAAGSPTGLQWVRIGGPLGGLGYDVRMRPDNPDIVYVTDAWSGVHVSTDGARSWATANDGIITRSGPSGDAIPVFCLTIDPSNPDIVWVGTQNTRGVYKSLDGGRSWVQKQNGIAESDGISFRGFTVDPRDSNTVYAAAEISSFAWTQDRRARTGSQFDLTKGVVYKTTDGGAHWTAIWRGDNLARYIWIDPRDPDVIYVSTGIFDREAANSDAGRGVSGGLGVLKSTDGGRSWQVLGREKGLQNLYVGSLFMHPLNPDILLAGTGVFVVPYNDAAGVYLSTDAGETWQRVLRAGHLGEAFTSVEFCSADPDVAYAASNSAVYRSNDGGHTWQRLTEGLFWGPPGVYVGVPIDLQVDPRNADRIFANNYGGGNFLSEDGGRTWSVASIGYTGAQMHEVVVLAADSARVYAIGRTGPFRSSDGGATWEGLNYKPASFGEWYTIAVDPSDTNKVLVSDEHQGVLLRSMDGGQRWSVIFRQPDVNANDPQKRYGFKTIAFAPSDAAVVYAGLCRDRVSIDGGRAGIGLGVYKSVNGSLSWSKARDALIASQNVNVLVVDSLDAQQVYAGTVTGGILKSVDGGDTWKVFNRGLRGMDVRALVVDPTQPDTLFAGVEGGGVYKSTNAGETWASSSSGMDPQAAIRDIVIDPTNSRTLYAADLRTGVYRSVDGGKTWSKLNQGLRTRAVTALSISADGGFLYAGTEGEGVFRLYLSPGGG